MPHRHSPVLFRWLGIGWTSTTCMLAAGLSFMLLGVILFLILFKHTKSKVERMSDQETRDFIEYGELTEPYGPPRSMQAVGPVVGAKAVMAANINTLRQAARAGDWLKFWLWPCMGSCWSIGLGLFITAVCPRDIGLIIVIWLVPAFLVFVAWFMAWAAIYTNIDINADP